jgi:hypothetical protein
MRAIGGYTLQGMAVIPFIYYEDPNAAIEFLTEAHLRPVRVAALHHRGA